MVLPTRHRTRMRPTCQVGDIQALIENESNNFILTKSLTLELLFHHFKDSGTPFPTLATPLSVRIFEFMHSNVKVPCIPSSLVNII